MADINKLVPLVFKWEGEWADNKNDRGGKTNMGVTLATWKQVGYDKNGDGLIDDKDLKLITRQDVVDVLRKHYWNRWKADRIENQSIANILVDWVWGSGSWGITIPQRILGVSADGVVGPKTLAAVNNYPDQEELFSKIFAARLQFINDLVNRSVANYEKQIGRKATITELKKYTQYEFKNGWINRLNDYKYEK